VPTLSLEHQRKRARALLKGVRRHDSEALVRVTRAGAAAADSLALHDAQLVVARENGFPSWSKLKAHIRSESVAGPLLLSTRIVAANRAMETARPHALYRDPLAHDLAGDEGRATWRALRESMWPGYATGPDPYLSISIRFFDDAILDAVRMAAIDQVVIVGAGLDTRAFRLEWPRPSDLHVFEVDIAEVFEYKERVLHRLAAQPGCQRSTIVTSPHGSMKRALRRAGFNATRNTAFLIERMQYVPADRADRLLREISALASEGSWIGFGIASDETLRSAFMQPYLRKLEAAGLPPWLFGAGDPNAWLASHGWNARSRVFGAPDISYGRWPYAYVPPGTPAIARVFFTVGWKTREEERWPSSR
jgi:methyltransferase (TIGR00027 family)